MSESKSQNIMQILNYLPHRYPFLLIDRLLDYDEQGATLTGLKNVSYNEPFFTGHFPHIPVMPGVLITEAMAQVSAILAMRSEGRGLDDGLLYYLVGIDKARFKRQVGPGDQLVIKVSLERMTRGIGKFNAEASVDGQLVASAEIMGALREANL